MRNHALAGRSRSKQGELHVGDENPNQTETPPSPSHDRRIDREIPMLLSILVAWTVIGFLACLAGQDY